MHIQASIRHSKYTVYWLIFLWVTTIFTLAVFIPSSLASPTVAPTLIDNGPIANDPAVSASADITATFGANPDPNSVSNTTFAVHSPFYGLITDAPTTSGNQITLNPSADFKVGDQVQVIATSGINNADGALTAAQQWGFNVGRVANRCFDTFEDSGEALTGVAQSSSQWIDIDGDNDLDVIVTGQSSSGLVTQILANNGSGVLSDVTGGFLTPTYTVRDGSLMAGDYNNDGHPDVLLAGFSTGFVPSIRLLQNNGATLTNDAAGSTNLPAISESAAAWGDYDNDGDLDLFLSGQTASGAISKIYRNDAGVLVDSGTDDDNLPVVKNGAAAWGDYDDDGDLDLVITGDSTSGLVAQLFTNDAGVLNDSGADDDALSGVKNGAVAWADIDDDGDLDLALSGLGAGGPITKIYENNANTFVDNGDALTGVTQSDIDFGDYDNDDDLDLAVIGLALTGSSAALYANDGSGSFTPHAQASANLTAVKDGSISFGDVDDDGDVDLLLTGESDLGAVSQLFTNENCAVSITAPASTLEGDAGTTPFTFVVGRSGDINKAVTVTYTVSSSGGGNAADASDLNGGFTTGTVTVLAGNPSQNFTINVSGDNVLESGETFNVTISEPVGEADLDTALAVGTILNDDSEVHISTLSADKLEEDVGNTAFTFTISRTGYLNRPVTIPYSISGDTNGTDFSGGSTSGNHVLPTSSASNVLTINVQGDAVVETDEDFTVTLGPAPNGTTISTGTASGTIQNDDGDLDIITIDASKNEGDSGNTTFIFEAVRTGVVTNPATVEYAVSGGSGANPADAADFTGGVFASGITAFAANVTTQTISIDVSGDTVFEPDEAFIVTLSNATGGAIIGIATATGTILNDDTGLAISAADASKDEGNGGTTDFTFTVTRSGNVSGSNDVNYLVPVGSGSHFATGSDFGGPLPSGTVSFIANEISKTITVSVAADTTVEADEPFTVTLSSPTNNANILTASAGGTIENDDGTVSIQAVGATGLSQAEGDSGTITYTYSVQLSAAALVPLSVDYGVAGIGGNPADTTDMNGSFPSGTLNFGVGESTKQVLVVVSGDETTEADETFAISLSNMTGGYTINPGSVTSTIENDDRSISVGVDSAVKDEGDSGDTPFTFLISRTGTPSGAISADYEVVLNNATADDFSGGIVPTGTVSLADGQITTTLTILINGDLTVELAESFDVVLSNPTGGTLGTVQATGIIQNDDSGYSVSVDTVSQPEGDTGTTVFNFRIKRNGSPSTNSTISYVVSGIGANPADEADFVTDTFFPGTLSFQAGLTDQEILKQIVVKGDTDAEADETFVLTLSNPTNGEIIATATATATIENDDDGLRISALAGEQSQVEGDSGTTSFDFTVDLIGTYTEAVTVDYAVSGSGTNQANAVDFNGASFPSGTVTFAVGTTSQTLTIPVQGDETVEPDEEFTITLSNVTGGAALGSPTITGLIENDDGNSPSGPSTIFLPIIMSPAPLFSDLIVESITVTGGSPTVVIKNIGTEAVTTDFWVDLYINPPTIPTKVNDTIDTLQSEGMTWGIKSDQLPLGPDEALTLTLSSSSLVTVTTTIIPAGATVYAQADSAALGTTYGGVLEGHEADNAPYNNIEFIINN